MRFDLTEDPGADEGALASTIGTDVPEILPNDRLASAVARTRSTPTLSQCPPLLPR